MRFKLAPAGLGIWQLFVYESGPSGDYPERWRLLETGEDRLELKDKAIAYSDHMRRLAAWQQHQPEEFEV